MERQPIIEMIGIGHKEKRLFGIRILKEHKDVLYISEMWKPKKLSWRTYGGLLFIPPLYWILCLFGGYKQLGKYEVDNSKIYQEMEPINVKLENDKIIEVQKIS